MFNFDIEKKTETSKFETIDLFDLVIIGAGPAGLNAALYAARKGMVTGIIGTVGGQLHNTTTVDNFLGIPLIEGKHLSDRFFDHIDTLDVPVLSDHKVTAIRKEGHRFLITTDDQKTRYAKTVLLATGGSPRMLDIPGEKTYQNKGVSYCTTCDAPFFQRQRRHRRRRRQQCRRSRD